MSGVAVGGMRKSSWHWRLTRLELLADSVERKSNRDIVDDAQDGTSSFSSSIRSVVSAGEGDE